MAPYNSQLKYDYDLSTRRLSTVSHYLNSTLAEQTGYTYTSSGLVTSQTTQPQMGAADTQCYSYDYQQQLTQAWTPASNDCAAAPSQTGLGGPAPYWSSWTTDTIGKTSQRVDRTPTTSTTLNYTYNNDGTAQPHAVTATTGSGGDKTYNIDAAGNTTSRPNAATTQTLAWNDEGKLATITTSGTTIQTNLYNATGTRIIRAETGRTTLYVAGTELTYTTATGALTANRSYTHAGQAIATRTGAANTTVTTLIPDRQGTTHQQVNTTTGAITTTWHAPYGLTRTNPSGWIGERGYVGGTNDTTTGLTHIGARDYDTTLNRFITTDPIHNLTDPLNYNPYTYANNNPTTNSDPTGEIMMIDGVATLPAYIGLEQRGTAPKNNAPQTTSSSTASSAAKAVPAKTFVSGVVEGAGAEVAELVKTFTNPQEIVASIQYVIEHPDGLGDLVMKALAALVHIDDIWNMGAAIAAGDEHAAGVAFGHFIAGVGVDVALYLLGVGAAKLAKAGIEAFQAAKAGTQIAEKAGAGAVRSCEGGLCGLAGRTCFVAGTMIRTERGDVPIEDVKVGDKVWSRNIETGKDELQPVVETYVRHADALLKLTVAGSMLTTTADHPFMVQGRNWVRAGDLSVGDDLVTPTGTTTLTGIEHVRAGATVYNFQVAVDHDYYAISGNTPILVHNADYLRTTAGEVGDLVHPTQNSLDLERAGPLSKLSDDDLLDAIHNPADGDLILVSHEMNLLGGHHRLNELANRVATGRIDPATPITLEFYGG